MIMIAEFLRNHNPRLIFFNLFTLSRRNLA